MRKMIQALLACFATYALRAEFPVVVIIVDEWFRQVFWFMIAPSGKRVRFNLLVGG
jgi:hypothetical protein